MISSLHISDTVELCITDKMLQKSFYKTKIQDINLNNVFYTMVPTSETGRPVLFFKDQTYELYHKGSEGILLWRIVYLGSEKTDNIITLQFQAISGPEKTQRREYFRQPVSIPAEFDMTDEEAKASQKTALSGRIIDLSGGGCSMMSSTELKLQSGARIRFAFRGVTFEFDAIVLDRIDYTQTKSEWDYKYRMCWIDFIQGSRDHLVRLVFDQQREFLAQISLSGR
ncbi:flagellar brake protein [Clostridium aminobutyricum]|uniref:PilZ domain-containing protein n=1 Tax=Clostridium aminobutyricum TaxID=33953 RepID=A0A939D9X0_CLOAM|nr:PilZ domain-containing protein [Clostridium aminobutyricum]MBN7773795.1 PilZ domain-containing protein [Clostridium aminobutyricum]